MPYINSQDREKFEEDLKNLSQNIISIGEMNYCISLLISNFIDDVHNVEGKVSYHHYNELIGVLECAKLELYRRLVAPYEDIKITDNGDVYGGLE
jgi:hypothetical protein